jgi:hypothetical protein
MQRNAGRVLRPIGEITDRAKRLRANHPDFAPPGPKVCAYCGSERNVCIDHIDGDESNLSPANLCWACKSCNTAKGILFRDMGWGVPTNQYNPGKKKKSGGAKPKRISLKQYGHAVMVMRGLEPGDRAAAHAFVLSAPASVRSEFTAKTWKARRAGYGPSGRRSADTLPF